MMPENWLAEAGYISLRVEKLDGKYVAICGRGDDPGGERRGSWEDTPSKAIAELANSVARMMAMSSKSDRERADRLDELLSRKDADD